LRIKIGAAEDVMRQSIVVAALGVCVVATLRSQTVPIAHSLEIKFVRDSAEYTTIARQTYRLAGDSVRRAAQAAGRTPWAVVLDLDETVLDNSAYQLDRAAYGLPFESASWAAWTERREAGAVPGVSDFIAVVRQLGGHVAWISNRNTTVEMPTRSNLQALGVWNDDDRLCLQRDAQHTKRMRRAEVVSGSGNCAWSGRTMTVAVFVGDQMGDFPTADENIPETGSDADFGRTCFLLPNPMYGDWTTRVTRQPAR
jgi:5'-nucleotidase (lipoprotein e(P4) family)